MAVLVQVVGAVLLVVGVGTFSWQWAIILAGVLLIVGGVVNEPVKPGYGRTAAGAVEGAEW